SVLPGSSATFTWNAGFGVTKYWLWVGNAPGGTSFYDAQVSGGTATVTGLPTNTTPVYVRLLSLINGAWQYNDYTFLSPGVKASMVSPANGSSLTGASTTFTWSGGSGVTKYWLWVGTQPSAEDVYDNAQGTNTSATVSGLAIDGTMYYVRLFSLINGAWQYSDYSYKAQLPSTPQFSVNSTNNLLVAKYTVVSPRDGSVFVQFGPTTSYGRSTMTLPVPQGGGKVNVYVAGMRQTTDYHMRATILYADHTIALDQDRVFTTGTLPAGSFSTQTVTMPVGAPPPNPGIELVNGVRTPSGMYSVFATDLDGTPIWYYNPGVDLAQIDPIKPLPNGDLLLVMNGSTLREINLAGDTIWEMSSSQLNDALANNGFSYVVAGMHHDIIPMPNGHILLLVNSNRTFTDLPGLPGNTVFLGDGIIDIDPSHKPVWVWDAFDHLDVNRRPYPWGLPDWMHSNGLVYMPDDGSLLLSIRHQSWIIKIDYANGTGTGNVVWRLGHGGDFNIASGDQADFQYAQHDPALISQFSSNPTLSIFDDGDFRVDNNGNQCDTTTIQCYSRAIIMQLNEGTMTATTTWAYLPNLYSQALGSAQVLPNGDMEADFSATDSIPFNGSLIEVTRENPPQKVWEMDVIGQWVYRAFRMPSLYPGVQW
ncbi:MAG: aryl-sulfate sulfotransferase, partial [Terriglobales bacterium]